MFVEPPFNMLILGMTGCGKTFYMLDMLEKEYNSVFDYIFLICPTLPYNKTYQRWEYKWDPKFITIPCTQDQVEDFLRYISSYFKGTNSLIILDDCAQWQVVKSRTSELVNLAFSARHYGFSTIVITQQLTSIAKPYRENISKLVTFYNPNRRDADVTINEFLPLPREDMAVIRNTLRTVPYARLEILLRTPYSHRVFP